MSTMLPIPLSPQPLKIPLFTVFSSIFPCANTGSQLQHIYKKSFQNIVFDSVFPMFPVKQTVIYTFFAIKAVNPSKNIAFDSVFVMFPVKHTVIYTFFAITGQSKTLVFAVFSMLWHPKTLQNLAMYNVFFFIFGRFSIAGKLPKWPQNSISNTLLRSDTPKSSKNVENTTVFWSRCETVFGTPPS